MSSFRTEIKLTTPSLQIDHQHPILAIGSCFAEHIGHKLLERKFDIQINPYGITYNPIAISQQLSHLITNHKYSEADLFYHNHLWHSFDHHGHFSTPQPATTLKNINDKLQQAHQQLKSSKSLLLTLGTAFVFEEKETKRVVNNCHKLPGTQFSRYRMDTVQVIEVLTKAFEQLQNFAKEIQCLITVSPVRHLRDGLIENQRSKATLLLAVESLCQQFDWVNYFPAYEIQMDDLRDYRFYGKDLTHPNDQATDYIWEKFADAFFSETTTKLNQQLEKIIHATKHRPFHPQSPSHQLFLQKQIGLIKQLKTSHPFIDFSQEEKIFNKMLD